MSIWKVSKYTYQLTKNKSKPLEFIKYDTLMTPRKKDALRQFARFSFEADLSADKYNKTYTEFDYLEKNNSSHWFHRVVLSLDKAIYDVTEEDIELIEKYIAKFSR